MNLEEMKLKDILQLVTVLGVKPDDTAYEVGKSYLIRTVTLYHTGRIKRITAKELVLEDAAWIPDTGRFSDCLKNGELNEVEPFKDDVIISRDSIIDATIWCHELPRRVK